MRRLLFALAVACNGDKAGPIAELEVEEQCVEHPSPLLPREDESGDTGDVAGIWDTDDDGDGWTLGDGDCDDGDPDVHPGFAEVAGNGLDEDCDGSEAGPTRRLGEAEWRWQGKNGNEGGFKIAFAGDTNGDGREEALVGVPDQGVVNDWDDYNDRVFLVNLSGDGSAEPIATVNPEESNGQNGRGTLLGANDLDGDGFDDVVVGIPWSTGPDGAAQDAYAGELLVYFGPVSGLLTESLADGRIRANLRSMHLGYSAALHPGTHDSEWMDLLVGAPGYPTVGSAFLWDLPITVAESQQTAKATFWADESGYAGSAILSAGDLDGDGIDEIAVGDMLVPVPDAPPTLATNFGARALASSTCREPGAPKSRRGPGSTSYRARWGRGVQGG